MRAVADTNVLVSAVLSKGSPPDQILQALRRGDLHLVTSAPLLSELHEVLLRPHTFGRLGWTKREVTEFMTDLEAQVLLVAPSTALRVVESDPDDDRVIEAALTGEVDYIVSGDRDLLDLGACQNIPIVTPARFVAILTTQRP